MYPTYGDTRLLMEERLAEAYRRSPVIRAKTAGHLHKPQHRGIRAMLSLRRPVRRTPIAPVPPWTPLTFRKVAAAVVAAFVVSVVAGCVARAFMALAAVASGRSSEFNLTASVAIPLFFAFAMIPGAVFSAIARRRRWLVLAAGTLFLCYQATAIATDDLGYVADISAIRWAGVIAAAAAIIATIVLLPFAILRLIDFLAPRQPTARPLGDPTNRRSVR